MAEQAREFQSVTMPESIRRWSSGDRRVPTAAKELQPLPQPLANRIPLEMHIEIISWLAWHKCSLLKCALVQRAWHPYCVHWLYRRICCRDGYRLIESAHQHESVKQYLTGTVKFDLDEEAAVTIALSMKMKTIMATELHPVGSQALGSLMPSLQILTLRKCDLRSRVDPVPWSSKTVTDLTLYATALRGDHRALSRIFDWFPQLRQLAFEGKLRVSHQFSSSSTLAAPSHRSHTPTVHQLRHLRLDVAGSGVTALLINLLIDLSLHTSLRTLETRIATQHMSAVERLLQKTGSSLTRLRALTTWTSDTVYPQPNLQHSTSLRTLELHVGYCCVGALGTVAQLSRVLSTISSPSLTQLVLQCNTHPVMLKSATTEPSSDDVLLFMHEIMKRPIFDRLRSVQVNVHRTKSSSVVATLSAWLAPWEARGIVSYT